MYKQLIESKKLRHWPSLLITAALCFTVSMKIYAATTSDSGLAITSLHSFQGVDGEVDFLRTAEGIDTGVLTWSSDGSIYGPTYLGGDNNEGTIFKVDASGNFNTVHKYNGPLEGGYPLSGVAIGADGSLYSVTSFGRLFFQEESYGKGTILKIAPNGTVDILRETRFDSGIEPLQGGNIAIKPDGKVYVALSNSSLNGPGYFVEIDSNGNITEKPLVTAANNNIIPYPGLFLGNDGNLYGTGWEKRAITSTTSITGYVRLVYKINPDNTVNIVHEFSAAESENVISTPGSLIQQDSAGNLYGTLGIGGESNLGLVYKIAPDNTYTVLHNFSDGSPHPRDNNIVSVLPGNVVSAPDGSLYGTTQLGGQFDYGTMYRITSNGVYEVLHDYTQAEGHPGSLLLGGDGHFYQLVDGGEFNKGAIYKIDISNLTGISFPVSTTNLSLDTNSAVVGQSVTLTATVQANSKDLAAPTGNVVFYDGSSILNTTPLTNGVATLTVSTFDVGTHSIVAKYSGDAENGSSQSSTSELIVVAGNIAPVANDDTFTITINGTKPIAISAPGVIRNDVDANGDALTIIGAKRGQPRIKKLACGTVELYRKGFLIYKPNGWVCKPVETFWYRVTDGKSISNAAKIVFNLKEGAKDPD